ncbi:MAG TPA: branched-chain-amino-acid transaminase [Candidatus Acidoferrales bacterium]|nr:branched-chain-amino-acid transaminase [Candidatus Acidoferrales bacterium]
MQIYLDGEWYSRETAKVSVFDHGLLYGDGIFEGIRVYNRRIFRLDGHLDRLYDSARALSLTIPLTLDEMAETVRDAVRRNQKEDGYIRLVVTRGVGDLGIDPRKCAKASVFIIVTDISVYPRELYARGVKVVTAATRQVAHDAFDPRVKSLNYLKNVLAKLDAQQAGAHEAIMLNNAGYIAECTADNLFVIRHGKLLTPAPQDGALEGITRGAVLELAGEAGIPATEARMTRYDVYTADECFLTGTGAELMPVTEADGRVVGDGKPGPITRKLTEAFHALVRHEGKALW